MTGRSSGDVIGPIPTISAQHAEVFFFVFGAIAVLVVLAAIAESVRRRSPLMLICLVGSVLCNPVEPIWDALGKLRFHHGNYWAWTEFPERHSSRSPQALARLFSAPRWNHRGQYAGRSGAA